SLLGLIQVVVRLLEPVWQRRKRLFYLLQLFACLTALFGQFLVRTSTVTKRLALSMNAAKPGQCRLQYILLAFEFRAPLAALGLRGGAGIESTLNGINLTANLSRLPSMLVRLGCQATDFHRRSTVSRALLKHPRQRPYNLVQQLQSLAVGLDL